MRAAYGDEARDGKCGGGCANLCTDKLDVYRESGGKLTLEKDRFYILATKVCAAVALRLGQ